MDMPQEFKCVFCKETFDSKEELQIHFRKHGDPKFHPTVKQKPRSLNSQSEKSNDGSEMVNCDVCPEVFPTISKAITHKHKVHPDHDAKYFCPWCGKLFTMKHLYNKHMVASHVDMEDTKSGGFHCDCCEVTFHVPSAMLYHNKFFHQKDSEVPSVGHSKKLKMINQEVVQIYYCPFCGEEYNNKINLNKHIGDDHSDENQSPDDVLRCPLCDAIFYHLDAYELHLTFHSIEDTYSEKNDMVDGVSEFSLETVPPIMERVESCDPNELPEPMGIEDFLQIAMDNPTEDESHKMKYKKHKKHKKSKKAAITLDEFLNMNTDVFGEGLDFQGIEEVPSRVVAKRLKVKKQPGLTKTGKKVMSRKEIEKLRKQGIVVKMKSAKNPGDVKKGVTSKQIKVSDGSKLDVLKSTEQTKSNIVSTSDDVLSKLLNQSNQIKIVRKTAQDKLNTEPSMSDDEQRLQTPGNEVECDKLQRETPPEADIEAMEGHSNVMHNENVNKVTNDEFTSNVKNIEDNAIPNNDIVHKDKNIKLSSNGTLKNSQLVSHLPINLKNVDIESNNQATDHSEAGIKKYTSSLSALRNISQHLTVKPLASPKNDMKLPSYESYDKEELKQFESKVETKDTERIKSNTEQSHNCYKEKPNALKHLSHLTVKSVSQTKNTTSPVSVYQETDEDDIDLPNVSQSELEHEDDSDTETTSKCNISKKINNPECDESSVKSMDTLKNISKNITIKSLTQPTHSSQSNVCKFDEIEEDYIDENLYTVINKNDKAIFQNKSHPVSKTQTLERTQALKISSPIISPSHSPKVTPSAGNVMLASKEVVPYTNEIAKVQPNNAHLLKHLTNITAKPIGNIKSAQYSVNKSTTQSFSIQNNLEQKQVTKKEEIKQDVEIFNIDDSDSDNGDNNQVFSQVTSKTEIQHKNTSQSLDALKNLSKHITIKSKNQQIIQSAKNMKPDVKETFDDNHESPNDDLDGDYSGIPEKNKVSSINPTQKSQVLQKTLQNLSKHITVKSRNSSPSSVIPAQDQSTQEFNNRFNPNDGSDSDSNPGRVKITEINHDNESTELYENPNAHINENVVIQSPQVSDNEIDDFFNEEADDEFSDIEHKIKANTLTKLPHNMKPNNDKFKNISKDITIKSLNENKSNSELPVAIRGTTTLPNNLCNELSIKPFKQSNKVFQEKNETTPSKSNKIIGQQVLRTPNPTNQTVSSSSNQMNTVNKEVTVKTFQTKTVIQEITTTVTKTIKTVNQTVKQEIQNSGQSSTPVIPQRVQGMRQTQPMNKNYQGVVVRHASPMMGAKVRNAMTPVRPGPPKNSNQLVPIRPGLSMPRPNNPRLPLAKNAMPSTSGANISGKSIKMSPNSKTTAQTKRPSLQEPSGPFSCFKKPKESLIPVSDLPNLNNSEGGESTIYFASSSQMSKSNIMNMTKTVRGNSVVSSTQMKSEVSTSSQQLSKLNNMSGLKVVRTSQVKQAVEEKQEVSAAKRTALEAIEKLQKQGLLVKKPRPDTNEDSEHSNVDDYAGTFTEEDYEYDV